MNTLEATSAEIQLNEYELFMIESLLTRFIIENGHRKDIADFKQLMNKISHERGVLNS